MSSRSDRFQDGSNMMATTSPSIMAINSSTSNDMNGATTCEDSCGGLVVIKQEPNTLQEYRSITSNYSSNTTEGCNMLQKVPSLSDLSDPENSLGKL